MDFEGLGWKASLRKKRSSYFVTLAKQIVVGNALRQGDDLFYYLVNANGRKAILIYLDCNERERAENINIQ